MPGTPAIHTFSIVAHDPRAQSWGVGVASKFLAVGAVVPYARAGVGAVATQALANLSYGQGGLDLMAQGASAAEALATLTAADEGRDHRQAGIVDRHGRAATFTGPSCMPWAGGLTGAGYAVQGNILVGERTVTAMAEAFERTAGELADRLHAALLAGDRAGGDRRGRQSAALLVVKPGGSYGGYTDRYLDLRVDDHPHPVEELGRLLELHHLFLGESRPEERIRIDRALAGELQALLQRLGYYSGPVDGERSAATQSAFAAFTGTENLEERVDVPAGLIDPPPSSTTTSRLCAILLARTTSSSSLRASSSAPLPQFGPCLGGRQVAPHARHQGIERGHVLAPAPGRHGHQGAGGGWSRRGSEGRPRRLRS